MNQVSENSAPAAESQTLHFHPKRHKKGRAWLWVVVALLCVIAGGVIGGGVVMMYIKTRTFPKPPDSTEMADKLTERMTNVVSVAEDENAVIREIIVRHMEAVRQIRRESFDNIRDQFDAMREEVGEVLGPERKEKWIEEMDRHRPKGRRHKKDTGPPESAQPRHGAGSEHH